MIFPAGDPKRVRIISVIAATVISLACGTNVSMARSGSDLQLNLAYSTPTQLGLLNLQSDFACPQPRVISSYEPDPSHALARLTYVGYFWEPGNVCF